jgi:hypothetical protein
MKTSQLPAEGVPEAGQAALKMWVAAKLAYDARSKGDFAAIEMKPTADGVAEIHATIKDAIGE